MMMPAEVRAIHVLLKKVEERVAASHARLAHMERVLERLAERPVRPRLQDRRLPIDKIMAKLRGEGGL